MSGGLERPAYSSRPCAPRKATRQSFAPPDRAALLIFQHPHAAVLARKLQGDDGGDAFLSFQADLTAVLAHDPLRDHQAEPVPARLGGVIRLEEPHNVLLLDAAARIAEQQV